MPSPLSRRDIIAASPQAAALAQSWQDHALSTQALIPGLAKSRLSFNPINDRASMMSGAGSQAWLKTVFGNPVSTFNDGAASERIHVLRFRGVDILAFGGGGTSWQIALGPADDPAVDGRSYGKPDLLSTDKEVSHFWPDFCRIIDKAMESSPEDFRSRMEALAIGASTPEAADPTRPPRLSRL